MGCFQIFNLEVICMLGAYNTRMLHLWGIARSAVFWFFCCMLLYQGEDEPPALPPEREELQDVDMDGEDVAADGCFVVDQDLIFIFAKSNVTIQCHHL